MPKSDQKWDIFLVLLPQTEKNIHKMKFPEKSLAWFMLTKMRNGKKEGVSY
jgi:hypothetical protein